MLNELNKKSSNLKKTKNLNQLLKNNFYSLLILPISLFSLDVKRTSDSLRKRNNTFSYQKPIKLPELDDGAEGLKRRRALWL